LAKQPKPLQLFLKFFSVQHFDSLLVKTIDLSIDLHLLDYTTIVEVNSNHAQQKPHTSHDNCYFKQSDQECGDGEGSHFDVHFMSLDGAVVSLAEVERMGSREHQSSPSGLLYISVTIAVKHFTDTNKTKSNTHFDFLRWFLQISRGW
jgi:hypothetical protein